MAYDHKSYEAGSSDVAADWQNALVDLLPEGVEARPSHIRFYIQKLQRALEQIANEDYRGPRHSASVAEKALKVP